MEIKEVELCDRVAKELIDLSADWEAENKLWIPKKRVQLTGRKPHFYCEGKR